MKRWMPLDRIVSLEPGKSARAVRNVPHTLAIFETHFPRFPVLPGVIILGSLAELADTLLREREPEEGARSWRLAAAEQIRYRHFVRPGDQLELEVELKERADGTAVLSGTARVDGRPVTTVRHLRMARAGGE